MSKRIGFIGGGNMAEGIIKGLIGSGTRKGEEITVLEKLHERGDVLKDRYGVRIAGDAATLSEVADILILAVRPQDVDDVAEEFKGLTDGDKIIVSICAGIKIERLRSLFGDKPGYARIMPNTMTAIRRGYSALAFGEGFDETAKDSVRVITDAIGKTLYISEDQFDAFTALSCAGPEWFILFATALTDAGVEIGISREASRSIVYENMEATGILLSGTDRHPYQITDEMNTPGGIGIAGFHSFQNAGLNGIVMDAVYAAYKRTTELG